MNLPRNIPFETLPVPTRTSAGRLYLERADFLARFGPDAECIGGDRDCRRPRDSISINYCVGCPYCVRRIPNVPFDQS